MIPLPECKFRHLYKLNARNFQLGVFDGKEGFFGIRFKWGDRFLDNENHWDCPNFATAKPLKDCGEIPAEIEVAPGSKSLFDFLHQFAPKDKESSVDWLKRQPE